MGNLAFCAIAIIAIFVPSTALYVATTTPPLLDVPTFSLATRSSNSWPSKNNMNILTYATPVSVKPVRMWAIGLFKGTQSHENFKKTGQAVLQMLGPKHIPLVKLLGGSSGRDTDKADSCKKLGLGWEPLETASDTDTDTASCSFSVLPGCVTYICLKQHGALIDCGGHDVAICTVEEMFVSVSGSGGDELEAIEAYEDKDKYGGGGGGLQGLQGLQTRELREKGVITAQGRVADAD